MTPPEARMHISRAQTAQASVDALQQEIAAAKHRRNTAIRRALEAGESTRTLAGRMGVSAQTISRWHEAAR